MTALGVTCAACGAPSRGAYSLHRDGFEQGPEVALCDGCGAKETPTPQELWTRIAARRAAGAPMWAHGSRGWRPVPERAAMQGAS